MRSERERALLQLGFLGCLLYAASACGAEAHLLSPDAGPAAADGSESSAPADASGGASEPSVTSVQDAGSYDLSTREGIVCARPALAPGLRFHESPLCAIQVAGFCDTQIGCKSHAECREQPYGFCGAIVDRVCHYPKLIWSDSYTRCTRDQDCSEMPGGYCEQTIVSAKCQYDECAHDHECAADQRCACQAYYNVCLEADCKTDDECAAGERCLASSPCAEIVRSYNCTTPDDECHEDTDCRDAKRPTCAFKEGRFRCLEACISDFL